MTWIKYTGRKQKHTDLICQWKVRSEATFSACLKMLHTGPVSLVVQLHKILKNLWWHLPTCSQMMMGRDAAKKAQVEFTPRPLAKLITHELYLWAQVEDIFVQNGLNVAFSRLLLKWHKFVSAIGSVSPRKGTSQNQRRLFPSKH